MIVPTDLYWDSCVLIRYLTANDTYPCFNDICQFVDDVKHDRVRIHFSTLAFAEIKPSHLKAKGFGSMNEFIEDMGANFLPIDLVPPIMIWTAELRDCQSTNPDPRGPSRVIGTPDALQLMSCLYLRDVLKVPDVVFHTFDTGSGKTWEGRTVPIIGFERWFPADARPERVEQVCGLNRCNPSHPAPNLGGLLHGGSYQSEHRTPNRPIV